MELIEIWRVLQVILGIGLVIFVHESGHFLAARWCKVRVDVFSLGFGPKLWSTTRGDTTYQVALVPLGGYVKMAGEEPGEDGEQSPDDLRSKSVGQRFLIFSGGVIMNVVFGLVIFPILYWVGIPFIQPLIGSPTPGGPVWNAGLEEGTRVLEINGKSVATFSEILNEVALGNPDQCDLLIKRPGQEQAEKISIVPTRSVERGLFELGFSPSVDPTGAVRITPGGAAELAGIGSDYRLISIKEALPGESFSRTLARLSAPGLPITADFLTPNDREVTTSITPAPVEQEMSPVLGVSPVANLVTGLRPGGGWEQLGVNGLQLGDRLIAIGDFHIYSSEDLRGALAVAPPQSELLLRRGGQTDYAAKDLVTLSLLSPSTLNPNDLALGADLDGRSVNVFPRSAAETAGLRDGDEILQVNGVTVGPEAPLLTTLRANTSAGEAITVLIRRETSAGAEELELTVTPTALAPMSYGLNLKRADFIYSVSNPLEALALGCTSCFKFLKDSWLTLQGIVTKRVPGKNVGGPIAIGVIAHSFASVAWTKFFFFLCVLSMNLAFLNVLPIPLLDGGHLFFLLIEKLKGSPVSDRIMGYSQLSGLVLIGFIFIYILYQDLERTFF
jgi:regulator of sigma E protease